MSDRVRSNDDPGAPIVRGKDAGGDRHFLMGSALHSGTVVEMRNGEEWTTVRYEGDWGHKAGLTVRVYGFGEDGEAYYPPDGTRFRRLK